jgi:hypothetical protein
VTSFLPSSVRKIFFPLSVAMSGMASSQAAF